MTKELDIPLYSPDELVRLEILQYKNPDGLHPIESNWRNLCRKLMHHAQEMKNLVENHHTGYVRITNGKCNCCPDNYKFFKFPEPFKQQ